jgi:methyltransferase
MGDGGFWGEGAWLLGFVAAQRLAELFYAQCNTKRLRAAGAVEFGAAHYPVMVSLHVFWLLALLLAGHARAVDPFWLTIFIALQVGRLWVIATLGRRWTTRVIVQPGAAPIGDGPFRFVKHPNYLIVALEIAVVPLALGLPGLALGFTLLNAAMLAYRIRVENQALAWAASSMGNSVNPGEACQ